MWARPSPPRAPAPARPARLDEHGDDEPREGCHDPGRDEHVGVGDDRPLPGSGLAAHRRGRGHALQGVDEEHQDRRNRGRVEQLVAGLVGERVLLVGHRGQVGAGVLGVLGGGDI